MNLYNALFNKITQDATLAGIVGENVYQEMNYTEVLPFIVIEVEKEADDWISKRTYDEYSVKIMANAATPIMRNSMEAALITLLDRSSWTENNVVIRSSNFKNQTDNDTGDSVLQLYTSELSFTILATL